MPQRRSRTADGMPLFGDETRAPFLYTAREEHCQQLEARRTGGPFAQTAAAFRHKEPAEPEPAAGAGEL